MVQSRVYEGTLDEITSRYGNELSGLHLRVIAVSGESATSDEPFYENAPNEKSAEALRALGAGHKSRVPLLSDAAVDRESMYQAGE